MESHTNHTHFSQQLCHQLYTVVSSGPILLNYLDQNEVFRVVNQSAAEFWGFSPEQMVGKNIHDLISEEDYELLKPLIRRVIKGEGISHETTFIDPDGALHYFQNTYTPDFVPRGKSKGLWPSV
jgi:PAS domain S-box-containing protein